ncbi:MAG: tRNA (adenosine(37)-N6)-threonylcarbamoyltransferase complex transferase subunit TsaD, partial [Oscillospiraceae bacterium]
VDSALEEASLTLDDMDAVAVTYAPGLIGALLVGVNYAKGLCMASKKPLIPTHHIRSHIAANYITHPELKPPFLCMVASGGHSHIIEVLSYTEFRVIGRTRDDAAGEAFDKAARAMGFPYPGGIYIDKAAKLGNSKTYKLPHPKVDGSAYDFSFSGLKTAVINTFHNARQKDEEINVNDMAASFQKTVCDIISDKLMAAAEEFGYHKIALAGGVSANSELRKRLANDCEKRGFSFYVPALDLCGDNAAMVGVQAYYEYQSGNIATLDLNATASKNIESV